MTATIQARGLVHDYGQGPVLDLPALTIEPGIHHLAGPNGAGKTTLLKILATLLTPTHGEVDVLGHDIATQAQAIRACVGYAGHTPSLDPHLTLKETLALTAQLHGLDPARARTHAETWELTSLMGIRAGRLSHGQVRRADLARATLHRPRVLLLDEPEQGLDPPARDRLRQVIERDTPEIILLTGHQDPAIPPDTTLHLDHGHLEARPA